MIYEVEVGKVYYSPSGIPFKVMFLAKHGQACLRQMVIYTNLVPTDVPIGQLWTLDESLFLKLFREEKDL